MKTWTRLFALFACCANVAAWAADDAPGTDQLLWRCWYDQQVHITCLIDTAPEQELQGSLALPANLPPFVMTMRTNPGSLRNHMIHIPLHTEPDDMEFVAVLAKSAACGSRRDCAVNFSSKLPPAEEVVALLNKNLPYLQHTPATALAAVSRGVLDDAE